MPKLWESSIDAHRDAVRTAALDAAAALVAEGGLTAVSMSAVASRAGVGRATLYKYFPDVDAVLAAWHERQLVTHLAELTAARDRAHSPAERLAAVLNVYARLAHAHQTSDLSAALHRSEHVSRAQQHLHGFLGELLTQSVTSGDVRADIPPAELATYCLHALTAAATLASHAAVSRLVTVTVDALRPHS